MYATNALETLPPRTTDSVMNVNDEDTLYLFIELYPLSQIICKTNNNDEFSFVGLLQHVRDWQKAVFESCEH